LFLWPKLQLIFIIIIYKFLFEFMVSSLFGAYFVSSEKGS